MNFSNICRDNIYEVEDRNHSSKFKRHYRLFVLSEVCKICKVCILQNMQVCKKYSFLSNIIEYSLNTYCLYIN